MHWSRAPVSRRTPIASHCSAGTEAGRSFRSNPSAKSPTQSWTAWSRILAGEWERYLRQQIELGGAEVVLSKAGKRGCREAGKQERGNRMLLAETTELE